MKEAHDHKRVTPEGRAIGFNLVRMTEPAIADLERQGEPDERCKTCAFRLGTVPNGCLQTMADAMKCALEGVPFHCHQDLRKPCHGWFAARYALNGATTNCPWEFSPPDPDTP
jgi:hypothetical protein